MSPPPRFSTDRSVDPLSALRDLWRRAWRRLFRRFTFEQWILLYRFGEGFGGDLSDYRRLLPPKDHFWADPFVIVREGKTYVFFEDYVFATQRGHISVVEINSDGPVGNPTPVLAEDHHLSYPFLLEHDGVLYMIPESREDRRVSLYRCTDFPDRWERVMSLMEGVEAVDATLHQRDGTWWLFVNMAEGEGGSTWDRLFLFSADDFRTQDWRPHPLNPVITDVTNARPAGQIFAQDGLTLRPSQDCGRRYGYALNLNAIEALTDTDYCERRITRAEPVWAGDTIAVHTYNAAPGVAVVDAQIRRWR